MITLKNKNGMKLVLNKKGAAVNELWYGKTLLAKKGVTVGRYANRISKGRLCIDDSLYQLSVNENGNTLHGGKDRFQMREWRAEMYDAFGIVTNDESDAESVVFSLVSVDGDQGFPGTLHIRVSYELTDGNELVIKYEASSDKDTVVNFTNHSYFNLNGGGVVRDHTLWVDADSYTEVDSELIPTGRILPLKGTDFDLKQGGQYLKNLDLNFVLNGNGLRKVAVLKGLKTGITMTCMTDQPGMQVFNTPSEICLETQHFPDSPNHEEFPSTLLKAGEVFRSTTIYKFNK